MAPSLTNEQLVQLRNGKMSHQVSGKNDLSSPFLKLLANAGRDIVSQLLIEVTYEPGEVVFKEGDPGDAMYIIRSGRIAIIKGAFESPTILGHRSAGDIIGEMALLEDQPRSASAVALEQIQALKIMRVDFKSLLSQNPSLSLSILSMLSERLRVADNARRTSLHTETDLTRRLAELQSEKQQLLELERLRQDTVDLIVHDLRHPISSLMGAVKILEMVLPEEILANNKQLLDIAGLNCDQLQLMVDSMLDVARMEAGRSQLELVPVDLLNLIQDNIARSKVAAAMENITLESRLPETLPAILVDEEKVNRILGNLLHNAIKYTPPNGTVVIEAEAQPNQILVCIIDAGPGIPAKDQELIFDRFTQLNDSQTRSGGFGLGLAFCKMAVEAHGGTIWTEAVTTEPGSKFCFTLPRSAESEDDPSS